VVGENGRSTSIPDETDDDHDDLPKEVLPELVVKVFSGWLRGDFLHRIAPRAEGSA
jgi:hypothetical protein